MPSTGLDHGTGPMQGLDPGALRVFFNQSPWELSPSPPPMPTQLLLTHEADTQMKPRGYGLVLSREQNSQETPPTHSPPSSLRDGAELRRTERACPS